MEGKVVISLDDYNHLIEEKNAVEHTLRMKSLELADLETKYWNEIKRNVATKTMVSTFITTNEINESNVEEFVFSSLFQDYDFETILRAVKELYDEWKSKQ